MAQFLKRFVPIVALVGACWAVFFADQWLWSGHLRQHGILPRHLSGLLGIFWAPFLHSSTQHLAANSVPLLILGGILCARSRSEFLAVSTFGILLGGAITWVIGRSAYHIGASGLVFCLFGYLASMAYFRRTFGALLLSAVCILGYGGMLKGILPARTPVSWEGHAAGLLSGIILAWFASKLQSAESTPGSKVPEAPQPVDSTNRFGLLLMAFSVGLAGLGSDAFAASSAETNFISSVAALRAGITNNSHVGPARLPGAQLQAFHLALVADHQLAVGERERPPNLSPLQHLGLAQ